MYCPGLILIVISAKYLYWLLVRGFIIGIKDYGTLPFVTASPATLAAELLFL